jgi:hypothetical protein
LGFFFWGGGGWENTKKKFAHRKNPGKIKNIVHNKPIEKKIEQVERAAEQNF